MSPEWVGSVYFEREGSLVLAAASDHHEGADDDDGEDKGGGEGDEGGESGGGEADAVLGRRDADGHVVEVGARGALRQLVRQDVQLKWPGIVMLTCSGSFGYLLVDVEGVEISADVHSAGSGVEELHLTLLPAQLEV